MAPSEHPFSLQHAHPRLALASNMLSKRPPSLRKRPPSRFCCLLGSFFDYFREPRTSKTMLNLGNTKNSLVSAFVLPMRPRSSQKLPKASPRHARSIPRRFRGRPWSSQEPPRDVPEAPLGAPEAPRSTPRALRDAPTESQDYLACSKHAQNVL